MDKDPRYATVRHLIETGYVTMFAQIFETIPKSVIAKDVGMNNTRFTWLMGDPAEFTLEELFRIAELLGIEREAMVALVMKEIISGPSKPLGTHSQS